MGDDATTKRHWRVAVGRAGRRRHRRTPPVCEGRRALLGTAQFRASAAGYRRLLDWLRSFGEVGQVGVEGTGSHGAALARYLTGQGGGSRLTEKTGRRAG